MNASLRIGVMAMMVLSIFSGVALADPTIDGNDAGNTASAASQLESAIPLGSWELYAHGTLVVEGDQDDWYQLNTQNGEYLKYQLDEGNKGTVEQKITDSAGSTVLGPINTGTTYLPVTGPTKSWDKKIGIDSRYPEYMFAMKRSLTQ